MSLTFSWSVLIAMSALGVAFVLVFVRLVRGPGLPDRVVALDMISYLAIGFVALFTLASGQAAYLDAAIILALIVFLATVAFARYIAQQGHSEGGAS